MNKTIKTGIELFYELEELKQENAALKTLLAKENSANNCNNRQKQDQALNGFETFPDHQNLRQLFDDYIKMYTTRDDNLTTHFSENFSGFTGGGDFLVKDKSEWVAITRQDFAQVKDPIQIELKDVSIQPLTDTIVVTTGFFIIHLPIKDHILSRETARLVLIFRKEPEGWKITHSSISIPYHLVREGEVYPMHELTERNQYLEELIAERTTQLSGANDKLQRINDVLAKEVSEHKKVELELQQSNQKLEAIISASPDGIGIISFDGKMQLMSDKLVEMYGYSIEQKREFIGRQSFDFIDPSNHKTLSENMHKLLTGENDHKIREYMAIKKDNSRFYVGINSTILVDSNGNPESILFVERDVTDRKMIELTIQNQNQQLQELNATKDKFFSILAHDLKSPFQGFMGMTELIAEDISSFSLNELSALAHDMNNLANNLYKLLTNLLDWAQMQEGAVSFKPKKIILSEAVFQNFELVTKSSKQKGIDLISEIQDSHIVYADEAMLNSVLRNLISNAIKFSNSGGKVIVSSKETEDNMIEISVIDNGIGMPDNLYKNLFKIEEKTGRPGTDGEESTGLGLLLCKEFIEKHGGKIRAENKENIGCTFYFTLQSAPDKEILPN